MAYEKNGVPEAISETQLSPADQWFQKGAELGEKAESGQVDQEVRKLMLYEALGCFDKSLDLEPESSVVHSCIGFAKSTLAQMSIDDDLESALSLIDSAIVNLQKSLELEPDVEGVVEHIGLSMHVKGEVLRENPATIGEATKCFAEARDVLGSLVNDGAADPEQQTIRLHFLALSCANIGQASRGNKQYQSYKSGAKYFFQLAELDPSASVLFNCGKACLDVAQSSSDSAERESYNQKALGFNERVVAIVNDEDKSNELDEFTKQTSFYNYACCLALVGRDDEALKWLGETLDRFGYDLEHIKQDSDLDSIRDREEFKRMIAKASKYKGL